MYCERALSLAASLEEALGPELAGALEERGFEQLTPVQAAMLAPDLDGRDLRISSQTGSGKTVAIGLAMRHDLRATAPGQEAASDGQEKGVDQRARPRAIVVVPTRELAKQVQEELAWLYAGLATRIAAVTGGGGYRDELRAFRAKPAVIVGTPGRLLDHLKRGAIDATGVGTIVLDEADRMLDLGFQEDIEAIFGFAPAERRTHLVSATFPREVKRLADAIQQDPVPVEGTPLGAANVDIEHLLHLVDQRERLAAIVNLLLEHPGAQTLIFARTRADVAELAGLLQEAGFTIAMLSGEMEQAERNRALAAFKRGHIDALVATDVAARGIDVSDVTRVLHAEPPTDADAYTHRSGRTGRAGKKGISSVLVTPRELARTTALLSRARVRWRFAPIPTAESLQEGRDQRLFDTLTADFVEGEAIDERSLALAERILASSEPARALARLVGVALRTGAEARAVTPITPPEERPQRERREGRDDRAGWIRFRISWGSVYGADARRLVAMMCRRGKIEGRDIGGINVGRTSSVVEVRAQVAEAFEQATARPDPRDPRIHIRRWSDAPMTAPPPAPAPVIPPDRPSRAAKKEAPLEIPADRPSRAAKKKDAPPSVPEIAVPTDRPSRAAKKSDPEIPVDRPSRAAKKKDAPPSSREVIREAAPTVPSPPPPSPPPPPPSPPPPPKEKHAKKDKRRGAPSPAVIRRERPRNDAPPPAPPARTSPSPSPSPATPPPRGPKPWKGKPPGGDRRGPPPWKRREGPGGGHAPPKRRGPR